MILFLYDDLQCMHNGPDPPRDAIAEPPRPPYDVMHTSDDDEVSSLDVMEPQTWPDFLIVS
jgi:hypothetical protein